MDGGRGGACGPPGICLSCVYIWRNDMFRAHVTWRLPQARRIDPTGHTPSLPHRWSPAMPRWRCHLLSQRPRAARRPRRLALPDGSGSIPTPAAAIHAHAVGGPPPFSEGAAMSRSLLSTHGELVLYCVCLPLFLPRSASPQKHGGQCRTPPSNRTGQSYPTSHPPNDPYAAFFVCLTNSWTHSSRAPSQGATGGIHRSVVKGREVQGANDARAPRDGKRAIENTRHKRRGQVVYGRGECFASALRGCAKEPDHNLRCVEYEVGKVKPHPLQVHVPTANGQSAPNTPYRGPEMFPCSESAR